MIFMRVCLLFLFTVSCSCLGKKTEDKPIEPVFPDKELKEIIIRGWYAPENKEKEPDMEKEQFGYSGKRFCYSETNEGEKKPVFNDNLRVRLYSKEGKLLSEDFLRLEYPENYDEEGRYSEAYLREQYESRPERYQIPVHMRSTPEDGILSSRSVISYLPYYDEGHEIHIVRLKGKKEVFLEELKFFPRAVLTHRIPLYRYGHTFDEKSQCHIASGPE